MLPGALKRAARLHRRFTLDFLVVPASMVKPSAVRWEKVGRKAAERSRKAPTCRRPRGSMRFESLFVFMSGQQHQHPLQYDVAVQMPGD